MDHRKIAVFGVYSTAPAAERAVDALMQTGFSNHAISVLLPDQEGAIVGTLGLLVGHGALAIPGAGPLIAAGPGIPQEETKRYEGHLKEGGVLLSVVCDATELTRAKGILTETGAFHIASTREAIVGSGDLPTPVTV